MISYYFTEIQNTILSNVSNTFNKKQFYTFYNIYRTLFSTLYDMQARRSKYVVKTY